MTAARSDAWKTAERAFAAQLQAAAGRVKSPLLEPLVTVTGRVGHIYSLGFDILVGNEQTALLGEAKRRRTTLSADAVRALVQVFVKAIEWERTPAFCIAVPPLAAAPAFVDTKQGKVRLERNWVALPLRAVCELLYARRFLAERGLDKAFDDWKAKQ